MDKDKPVNPLNISSAVLPSGSNNISDAVLPSASINISNAESSSASSYVSANQDGSFAIKSNVENIHSIRVPVEHSYANVHHKEQCERNPSGHDASGMEVNENMNVFMHLLRGVHECSNSSRFGICQCAHKGSMRIKQHIIIKLASDVFRLSDVLEELLKKMAVYNMKMKTSKDVKVLYITVECAYRACTTTPKFHTCTELFRFLENKVIRVSLILNNRRKIRYHTILRNIKRKPTVKTKKHMLFQNGQQINVIKNEFLNTYTNSNSDLVVDHSKIKENENNLKNSNKGKNKADETTIPESKNKMKHKHANNKPSNALKETKLSTDMASKQINKEASQNLNRIIKCNRSDDSGRAVVAATADLSKTNRDQTLKENIKQRNEKCIKPTANNRSDYSDRAVVAATADLSKTDRDQTLKENSKQRNEKCIKTTANNRSDDSDRAVVAATADLSKTDGDQTLKENIEQRNEKCIKTTANNRHDYSDRAVVVATADLSKTDRDQTLKENSKQRNDKCIKTTANNSGVNILQYENKQNAISNISQGNSSCVTTSNLNISGEELDAKIKCNGSGDSNIRAEGVATAILNEMVGEQTVKENNKQRIEQENESDVTISHCKNIADNAEIPESKNKVNGEDSDVDISGKVSQEVNAEMKCNRSVGSDISPEVAATVNLNEMSGDQAVKENNKQRMEQENESGMKISHDCKNIADEAEISKSRNKVNGEDNDADNISGKESSQQVNAEINCNRFDESDMSAEVTATANLNETGRGQAVKENNNKQRTEQENESDLKISHDCKNLADETEVSDSKNKVNEDDNCVDNMLPCSLKENDPLIVSEQVRKVDDQMKQSISANIFQDNSSCATTANLNNDSSGEVSQEMNTETKSNRSDDTDINAVVAATDNLSKTDGDQTLTENGNQRAELYSESLAKSSTVAPINEKSVKPAVSSDDNILHENKKQKLKTRPKMKVFRRKYNTRSSARKTLAADYEEAEESLKELESNEVEIHVKQYDRNKLNDTDGRIFEENSSKDISDITASHEVIKNLNVSTTSNHSDELINKKNVQRLESTKKQDIAKQHVTAELMNDEHNLDKNSITETFATTLDNSASDHGVIEKNNDKIPSQEISNMRKNNNNKHLPSTDVKHDHKSKHSKKHHQELKNEKDKRHSHEKVSKHLKKKTKNVHIKHKTTNEDKTVNESSKQNTVVHAESSKEVKTEAQSKRRAASTGTKNLSETILHQNKKLKTNNSKVQQIHTTDTNSDDRKRKHTESGEIGKKKFKVLKNENKHLDSGPALFSQPHVLKTTNSDSLKEKEAKKTGLQNQKPMADKKKDSIGAETNSGANDFDNWFTGKYKIRVQRKPLCKSLSPQVSDGKGELSDERTVFSCCPSTIRLQDEEGKGITSMAAEDNSIKEDDGLCIVCGKCATSNTLYCSEDCIEDHSAAAIKAITDLFPDKDASELDSVRISVCDKKRGKTLLADRAPCAGDLKDWLKMFPSFRAVVSPNKKKQQTEKKKLPPAPVKKDYLVITVENREYCKKGLKSAFIERCKEANIVKKECELDELAQKIEMKVYESLHRHPFKYRAKARSLVFNIKDRRNPNLVRRVLNAEISPYDLVQMNPAELASSELAKWRKQESQRHLELMKAMQMDLKQPSCHLTKKTHKGEIEINNEIDDIPDDTSKLGEPSVVVPTNSTKKKFPDISSIKFYHNYNFMKDSPPPPPLSKAHKMRDIPGSVWKGTIHCDNVTEFPSYAFKVSGNATLLNKDLPERLQFPHRVKPCEMYDYFAQVKQSHTTELVILKFKAESSEELKKFDHLYRYFYERKRCALSSFHDSRIKDIYIIPLASNSPIPTVLLPFTGPGLPARRNHTLLGVIVRYKKK